MFDDFLTFKAFNEGSRRFHKHGLLRDCEIFANLRLKLYYSPSRAWTWLFSSADWMTAKVPPCSVQASSPASQLLLEA